MLREWQPTLRQMFALSMLALMLSLASLFYLFWDGSQRTILQSSERFRDMASREVVDRVTGYLNEAPLAVATFERQIGHGLVNPEDVDSVEAALLSLVLANDNVSEASFTYAKSAGFDRDGNLQLRKRSIGEVTVLRSSEKQLLSEHTWFDGRQFFPSHTSCSLEDSGGRRLDAELPLRILPLTRHSALRRSGIFMEGCFGPTSIGYSSTRNCRKRIAGSK